MRNLKLAALALVAMLLAACTSSGPYNLTVDGADTRLMLKGYDPVAYFVAGKHVLGQPGIKAEHDGVVYRFASEDNKAAFLREPARFVPQYGGFCSNGIVYGIPWGGDPDTWKIIDGKLYMFGGEMSRNYFLMDQKKNLELAERYWNGEIKGSNAFVQRTWRLAWRVPHYKTGKELADEWQKRQSAK
ncbi:MAG TPA: YHS domain-containing (seleno)protein [Usitatibacteraceae bacterium]|nr:YHS domain-containing (seleno)protein [Usitatibacteraceae bacterium]